MESGITDYTGKKTGLFIPIWEAKLLFYCREYREREKGKNGGFGDLDPWDPGHKGIHSARHEISSIQAYFDNKIGSGSQQIAGNRELQVSFFGILDF